MLISEVKELLKKYKEEELRLLISEMYKSMPKKLHNMLCYACGYYIFSSDDLFRSVGIEQTVFKKICY